MPLFVESQDLSEAKTYHHRDLRNALIDAGMSVLRDEGVGALSLRDLARRIGVSHSAPHAHFADKRALLAALAARGFHELSAEIHEAISAAPSHAQLLEMGVAYVRFGLKRPALYQLMFSTPDLCDRTKLHDLDQAAETSYESLCRMIQRLQQAGLVRATDDPQRDARSAWAMVHGIVSLLLAGSGFGRRSGLPPDQLARECMSALVSGIAKPTCPET